MTDFYRESFIDPACLLIHYQQPVMLANFLRREKRFSVEVEADGKRFWAHTNNSGSMMGLLKPGARVLLSKAANPNRKLAWTLELMELDGMWIGVNTLTPNRMLRAAHAVGQLPFAAGYSEFRSEVKRGESRLDGLFTSPGLTDLWVESKNVTLVEDEIAAFPDAVTTRGQKHLRTLMDIAAQGDRAACFFLVQRSDGRCFSPADYIDPEYAELFWQALEAGVEMYPMEAVLTLEGIGIGRPLPLVENFQKKEKS